MKLLVITQKVDKNDSVLGFFHLWLQKLAERVDHLYVICLEKGEYALPNNVTVLSLGKENKVSKITYLRRFFRYIFQYRKEYQSIFVHMNPEYCILGGLFWRLWGKKILLWYTHKAVNWRRLLAQIFVNKIFTASRESFRWPRWKAEIVGHGIPVEMFSQQKNAPFGNNLCLLSVGRISRSKDLETAIDAVAKLSQNFSLPPALFSIVGRPITKEDEKYIDYLVKLLQKKGLSHANVQNVGPNDSATGFRLASLRYEDMPSVYQQEHILVHMSQTGSLDKVVLEALAAGRIVVTSSEAFAGLAKEGLVYSFPPGNSQKLAETIEKIYKDGILKTIPNQRAIDYIRKNHSLENVITKIVEELTTKL